jgi:hypothetical protein
MGKRTLKPEKHCFQIDLRYNEGTIHFPKKTCQYYDTNRTPAENSKGQTPKEQTILNHPAAKLPGIKMNFTLLTPDTEHRGIFLITEPVSKRPILANLCVGLKFQSSKYSMYSSG